MPEPFTEIVPTRLQVVRGINYWSRGPVTRLDLVVGAYDEISSAELPGVPEALLRAMPGLVEHHCSVGERGGFVSRLRRGTYAAHIVEHVAIELQSMIGHEVGFGRTRGGDLAGQYTVVFEHQHTAVGLRAAALALAVVQRALGGSLGGVEAEVRELAALATQPDTPPNRLRVRCGIAGSEARRDAARALARRLAEPGSSVVEIAPAYLLEAGLPYHRSDAAIVLDLVAPDVPPRLRERERVTRLMGILVDGVDRGDAVVCPAEAGELHEYVRERGRALAVFADELPPGARERAGAIAFVKDGRIVVELGGTASDAGALDPGSPIGAQVAAALAARLLRADAGARASRSEAPVAGGRP